MPKDACYKKYASKMPNSARRSQLMAKCRKSKGQVKKTQKGADLKRWGKEKWKDKISGKDCGSGGKTEYCRPSKKVSSKTPKSPTGKNLKKKISEKKSKGMGKRVLKASLGGVLLYKKGGKSPKASMKCGQTKRSTRKNKKIMKLYCVNGKKKLVHAGDKRYVNNVDSKRKGFKARHKCSTAKPGTARHLACTELWEKGGILIYK